mgnify:CR=1 FL=1
MSFQPIIPSGGLAGWRFLERTFQSQTQAFQKTPDIARDTDYFEANIGRIDTAQDLVSDRRLLRVALGAFGLDDDINNKFFIRKILDDGVLKDGALANRMSDDRYKDLTKAFGFGDFSVPRTKLSDFGSEITAKFRSQQFEVAVGDQDEALRLALYAQRELESLVSGSSSDDIKWFKIMGTPPLRKVFETALGLPSSIGQLDIDKQLGIFRGQAKQKLGISALSELKLAETRGKLIQTYLLRTQIADVQTASAGSIALSLLQSSTFAHTTF